MGAQRSANNLDRFLLNYGSQIEVVWSVIRKFSWSLPINIRVQRSRFHGRSWRVILVLYSSSDNDSPTVLKKAKVKLDAGWEAELEFQI